MLSKNKIRLIRSLSQKKCRVETGCFLAEGNKLVADLLPYFDCELLVCSSSWLATQGDVQAGDWVLAEQEEIDRASLLKNPQQVIAVFRQTAYSLPTVEELKQRLSIVLDGIQDPGNLGAIVRLADWFGIEHIICSKETADIYNPKTVQASMGALARVKVHYADIEVFLKESLKGNDIPVYGTFLEGNDIYREPLSAQGLIVMGNEGNGISKEIKALVSHKLFIPSYPAGRKTSESLNVAIAAAIVCAEFRRRQIQPV